jgi:hypothetical protein
MSCLLFRLGLIHQVLPMMHVLQVRTGCTAVAIKKAIKYVNKISVPEFTRRLTRKSPPRYAEHKLKCNIDSEMNDSHFRLHDVEIYKYNFKRKPEYVHEL